MFFALTPFRLARLLPGLVNPETRSGTRLITMVRVLNNEMNRSRGGRRGDHIIEMWSFLLLCGQVYRLGSGRELIGSFYLPVLTIERGQVFQTIGHQGVLGAQLGFTDL